MNTQDITATLREVSELLFDAEFAETNGRKMALRARATRLYGKAMRAFESLDGESYYIESYAYAAE